MAFRGSLSRSLLATARPSSLRSSPTSLSAPRLPHRNHRGNGTPFSPPGGGLGGSLRRVLPLLPFLRNGGVEVEVGVVCFRHTSHPLDSVRAFCRTCQDR